VKFAEQMVALGAAITAPLALRLLPLPQALLLLDRWPRIRGVNANPAALADRVHRWLALGFGCWRSTCLTRSAVLYAILRQHGYRPSLHLGVLAASEDLEAHAWVSVSGIPIADVPANIDRYRPLWVHGG